MSLRRLEPFAYEVPLRPSPTVGERGRFDWLKPEQLVIDARYQRNVGAPGKRNIKQIVEHFAWAMFSPLIVSPRGDGLYAVIDGQHRAIAALTHGGIGELPCWIIAGGAELQAKAFAVINGQVTPVPHLVLFRARIAAGDKQALAIVEAAAAAGVTIAEKPSSGGALPHGVTQAPSEIGSALAWWGRELTVAALNCITKTGDHPGGLRAGTIAAFGEILYRAPKWRHAPQLHDVIRRETLTAIHSRALQLQGVLGGSLKQHLIETLVKLFTVQLGACTLLPLPKSPAQRGREAEQRDRGLTEHLIAQKAAAGAKGRANQVRLPAGRMAAKPEARPDTAAMVAEHLAAKGARRFEAGATGDAGHLIDWLNRIAKVPAGRRTTGRSGPKGGKIYEIRGKHYDVAGLITVVNAERKKRGLEPISIPGGA